MRKINLFKFFPVLFLISLIAIRCEKNKDGNSANGKLQIIKNTSLSNNKNALQAIFTSSDNSTQGFYYGTFNASGEPDSIMQIVIKKTKGDTSANIFLDNQQRIKSVYMTYAGVKQNSLLTFDYSKPGKILVGSYYYNFNNDSSKLLHEFIVDNISPTYPLVSKTSYAFIGGGFLQILSGNGTVADKYGSQLILTQGAIAGLNVVILTGSTAIGCLLLGFPGCVLGGTVGNYIIHKPASANASEISTPPVNSPQSPTSQTQNTQLQTKSYYVGSKNTTGVVPFGGGYYSVEYTNLSIEIKQNTQTNQIISANISANMKELKQANSSPIPGIVSSRHYYFLKSYTLNGPTLTMTFTQDPNSFPQNEAVFVGGINGNNITGTFTLNRLSNGLTCVTSVPVNAVRVN
jgi:hypothetical protein